MSLGIGHKYWVRVIRHHYGDLKSCIEYMNKFPPENDNYWYELHPNPKIKKGTRVTCCEYSCDLVTDGNF